MKKLLLVLVAALQLLLFPACRAQKDNDKSLLWRISGHGLNKDSYLFGTIHMICPGDYLWTGAMKKSLASCNKVCFEIDMDDPNIMTEAGAGLMDTSGKQLQDYFSPEQYRRLQAFMRDSLETDIAQMQSMKPVVLETILMAKSVNCSFPVSYEANIMEEAGKSKKEIIGLESVKEQLDVFNTIQDDSAASMLISMADSFAASKKEYAQMLNSYKSQDLPALYRQVKASKELGDHMGAFLEDRNAKWIPRMAPKMDKDPIFFAVGAAHLYGDLGVINLLRKAGYTVTAVR